MLRKRHKASTDDEAVAADGSYLRLFQPIQKENDTKQALLCQPVTHDGEHMMAKI